MKKDEFLKLNGTMSIQALVRFAQDIDRLWQSKGHEKRIQMLKQYLEWSQEHRKNEVSELHRHLQLIHDDMSQEHFLNLLIPLERSYTKGILDHEIIVEEGDKESPQITIKSSIIVVLDNIRSSFNVGSAFRTSECFGVEKLLLCGYTSTPENSKTAKTAMGTSELVPWESYKSSLSAIQQLQLQGIKVFGVETGYKSQSIYETNFSGPIAFTFGNERHGLSPEVLKACDEVVKIPLFGLKNSLNVGVTLGACLSEARRQAFTIR